VFYFVQEVEDEFLEAIEKQKQGILNDYEAAFDRLQKEYEEMEKQLERENASRKWKDSQGLQDVIFHCDTF